MNQVVESKVNDVVNYVANITGDTSAKLKEVSTKIRNIISGDRKILSMPPEVISDAIIKAMIPDKSLSFYKDVYFIPYGNQLNVEFSHNFLSKLAYKSGKVKKIETLLVFEGDEVWVDESGLHYKINPFDQSGEFKGIIVLVKLSNGETIHNFVTKQHIENARNASRSKNNGPWKTWYYEMAKKVAIKNTFKTLDISPEIEEAISIDNENNDLSQVNASYTEAETVEMAFQKGNILDEVMQELTSRGVVDPKISNGWIMFDEGILTEEEEKCAKVKRQDKYPGKVACKIAILHACFKAQAIDAEVEG
jgi:phage RecT family recombinase